MKRIVSTLIAVFVVGWASLAEAVEAEVVLYPTISPVIVPSVGILSPSFAGYAANTLLGLSRGMRNTGGSIQVTPTAFNTIGIGPISNKSGKVVVSVYDTYATKDVSWRGVTPPHGAFANERGTHHRAAVAITSQATFTLADVIASATFADAPGQVFSIPLGGPNGVFASFNNIRLSGIWWGPDGRPGTGDDIVYGVNNPGTDATPINQLLFVGFGDLDFADPADSRSDAEQFADYLAFLQANAPYTFTRTYSLRGVSSTVNVTVDLTARPGKGHPGTPRRTIRPFQDR
jgi:hypothetical protein